MKKTIVGSLFLVGISLASVSPVLAMNSPMGMDVTRFANSDTSSIKYATLSWQPVVGAVSYNLYTVGSSDVLFDKATTNTYTLKFNSTSSWYFKVAAVDASGVEGPKSDVVTVSYPQNAVNLPVPQHLRITEIETMNDPSKRNVHIFWDPIPGVQSYVVYTNAGSTFWYLTTVDTNLLELPVSPSSTSYIAVAALQGKFESARSSVLTVEVPATQPVLVSPTATPIVTPTTPVTPQATVVPTPKSTPSGTPQAESDAQIQKLKSLEQDVKSLKQEVSATKQVQEEQGNLLQRILSFLQRLFRL